MDNNFNKDWTIISAGNINNFNCCTISWGSMGTIWNKDAITIYIHPARYTSKFLETNDYFTVSFFDEKYKKDLAYIGSHSGKDEDKISKTNLTPIEYKNSVSFKEAKTTYLCRKLYAYQFNRDGLSKDIQDYYAQNKTIYPDFKDGWQPHNIFIGEIIK